MKFLLFTVLLQSSSLFAVDLVKQSCVSCHGKNSDIAPTFEKVLKAYSAQSKSKRKLMGMYSDFISDPSVKNVVLKGAYKEYGPMPKINLSKTEVKKISHYLAMGDYSSLYEKVKLGLPKDPFAKGKVILKATKSELGRNLLEAIKKRKTVGAVDFCSTKAIPITEQKMKELKSSIKRATDKPRNPKNLASSDELKYIQLFKKKLIKGESLIPVLVKKENVYHFYSPIVTNQMCMQCHGREGSEVKPEVLSKIKKLYPDDQATGYGTNEVRGVFSIRWHDDKGDL